jgi:alpha-D-xyloside xylohydrolase
VSHARPRRHCHRIHSRGVTLGVTCGYIATLCLVVAVAGCGDDDSMHMGMRAPGTASVSAGGFGVTFNAGGRELTLLRAGTPLLRFPADSLQLGRVDAVDDTTNYDPYRLVVPNPLYQPPPGLRWLSVTSAAVSHSAAASFSVALQYEEGKRATLRVDTSGPGSFRMTLVPDPQGPAIAFFRLRPRVDSSEAFYGLGEYLDTVNHRGKTRAMQLEVDAALESLNNEAHVPIPFVIGTRGWGLFVESPYPGVFDVATQAPDLMEVSFGTGRASADGLVVHLFGAAHPLDVTQRYYEVTGYPRLPARWALGPWIWRDENRDQAQVESDLHTIRDLDLATTAYWIDRPYATAVNTFDFNPAQFPAPQAMIDLMHALGFRTALWHAPYLDRASPATRELREYATDHGYFPPRTGLLLNNWGKPMDFTNPDAYGWWQGLIRRYTDMGVEGFKLDYGEDVAVGLSSFRNVWKFFDGSDERTMHGRYQLFYHRVYAETLPEAGGFLLCRHGTYGDQVNARVIWPGDLDANFARHGEVVTDGDESYTAVGGLPASVIAGLTLGPSGFPFYGADTGGYQHAPPDKETFTRWFEQTALSTVMQIGTSANNVAWEFAPETGFDAEMLDWYRAYTRLHLRLFPYEWTYATNLARDGRPIERPLGLAYPELGVHPSDTYLFGDHLLVAPVLERGQRERTVMLPPGQWTDWWTGDRYDGDREITVGAPLGTLPLFLRNGGIVPMLRPTIDTMAPVSDTHAVDSYATTPGVLYARVAAGAGSSFVLFDGAELRQEATPAGVSLYAKDGEEFRFGTVFEVVAAGAQAVTVADNGTPLRRVSTLPELEAASAGWTVEMATNGSLFVKVPSGEHRVQVEFKADS